MTPAWRASTTAQLFGAGQQLFEKQVTPFPEVLELDFDLYYNMPFARRVFRKVIGLVVLEVLISCLFFGLAVRGLQCETHQDLFVIYYMKPILSLFGWMES